MNEAVRDVLIAGILITALASVLITLILVVGSYNTSGLREKTIVACIENTEAKICDRLLIKGGEDNE